MSKTVRSIVKRLRKKNIYDHKPDKPELEKWKKKKERKRKEEDHEMKDKKKRRDQLDNPVDIREGKEDSIGTGRDPH